MGLQSFLKTLKAAACWVSMGEVLQTRDMTMNRGLTALRLNVNRNPRTGEVFTVMGLLAAAVSNGRCSTPIRSTNWQT